MGKVTVFGSFIVDLSFLVDRLSAPGETVFGKFTMGPGGKGSNQAVAAKLAGADVNFITILGEDIFSNIALDFYKKIGMKLDYVYQGKYSHTGAASIEVDKNTGQNKITVAPGVCLEIPIGLIGRSLPAFFDSQIFLTQLECNFPATMSAIMTAKDAGLLTILNPAPAIILNREDLEWIDIIVPNETEASFLTGISLSNPNFYKNAADKLSESVKTVIITLGDKGVYCPAVSNKILPPFKVKAIDTTGAGDAFCGALAASLAERKPLKNAINFAQAAAAISVTRQGTAPAMPKKTEIIEFLDKGGPHEL